MGTARRQWWLSLFVSTAAVIAAAVWLAVPETYPYGSGENVRVGLNHLIERGPGAVLLMTAALGGMALAGIALRPGASSASLRIAGVGAAVETVFFAIVMADASAMSALGYAVALAAPVGAVVIVVLVCRTWRPVGYVLAVLVPVLAIIGYATGALGEAAATVGDYLSGLAGDQQQYYARTAWGLAMAGAVASWAWTAAGTLFREVPPWLVSKWGRIATVVAAMCLVPYGLARLSWLTPWRLGDIPMDSPNSVVLWNSDPEPLGSAAVIQGGLFALACAVGVVLTFGLISRWGEVFPRWFPFVGGREVPVKLAVVPGLVVATVVTLSSSWSVLNSIDADDPFTAALKFLFLPMPIWGAALAVAVLAYWGRRTSSRRPQPAGGVGGDRFVV